MPSAVTLTLTISDDGLFVGKDPDSFHVGPPKSPVTICVVNTDRQNPHQVRMERITHRPSGKLFDPLTGPKLWPVLEDSTRCTNHKVKDGAAAGPYDYVVFLDSRELSDPEIVVDPPFVPPPHGKKKQAAARGTAKKRQTAARATATKRRTAKRGAGKKPTASRPGAKKKRRSRR